MASQITHIVYAKKYFESIGSGKLADGNFDDESISQLRRINRDEFILGVVFPDIRLLEPSIKRKDTHLRFDLIDLDFSGLTSFEAGWKFHLYCDMRREEILNDRGFYKLERTAELYCRPAKLLEDKLVYDKYNNWEKLAAYFRNPPVIRNDIGADQATIVLWYAILAKYIEESVTNKSISIFLSKQPSLAEKSKELLELVSVLEKNEKVVKTLFAVKEEIVVRKKP